MTFKQGLLAASAVLISAGPLPAAAQTAIAVRPVVEAPVSLRTVGTSIGGGAFGPNLSFAPAAGLGSGLASFTGPVAAAALNLSLPASAVPRAAAGVKASPVVGVVPHAPSRRGTGILKGLDRSVAGIKKDASRGDDASLGGRLRRLWENRPWNKSSGVAVDAEADPPDEMATTMRTVQSIQWAALGVISEKTGLEPGALSMMMSLSRDGGLSIKDYLDIGANLASRGIGLDEMKSALSAELDGGKFGKPVTKKDPVGEEDMALLKFQLLEVHRAVEIKRNGRYLNWKREWLSDRASGEVSFAGARVDMIEGDYQITLGKTVSDGVEEPIIFTMNGEMIERKHAIEHLEPLIRKALRDKRKDAADLMGVAAAFERAGVLEPGTRNAFGRAGRMHIFEEFRSARRWDGIRDAVNAEIESLRAMKTKDERRAYLREAGREIMERMKAAHGSSAMGFHYNLHGGQAEGYVKTGGILATRGDIALQYTMSGDTNLKVYFFRGNSVNLYDILDTGNPQMMFLPSRMGHVLNIFRLDSDYLEAAFAENGAFNPGTISIDFDENWMAEKHRGLPIGIPYSTYLAPPIEVFQKVKKNLGRKGGLSRDEETLAVMRQIEAAVLAAPPGLTG